MMRKWMIFGSPFSQHGVVGRVGGEIGVNRTEDGSLLFLVGVGTATDHPIIGGENELESMVGHSMDTYNVEKN